MNSDDRAANGVYDLRFDDFCMRLHRQFNQFA